MKYFILIALFITLMLATWISTESSTKIGQLTVLGITLGIFFGTLGLKKKPETTRESRA